MWGLSWVFVACVCQVIDGYKILVIFPFPGRSHAILGEGVVRNLVEDGQEVTYVTPFPSKIVAPNLHQINVSENLNIFPTQNTNISAILNNEVETGNFVKFFSNIINLNDNTARNKDLRKLMDDPNVEFDVCIFEWMLTEIYVGYASVFNCHYIWVSTVEPHWMVLNLIDENPNPAYNTDIRSTNIAPLTFIQRAKELFSQILGNLFKYFLLTGLEKESYSKTFAPSVAKRGRNLPPYEEIIHNASLMLGNSHVSLGEATRLPQNYKPIGGYHIDTNLKPLQKDVKIIMDNAKHGVIYFSMGSNLKSKDIPDAIKKDLIKMFGSLKQTVLWKFEEELTNLPTNLHILKWAPQTSILDHPNCILFITHGGQLSTTETIHYGVPIIGIPVFADQFTNVGRAVNKGFAKKVDFTDNLASELKLAIEQMIGDPSYRQKVKELSLIYHDRPVAPGKEMTHWVKHVARTQGAPHLRSPALMVPWYQKIFLDLAVVVVIVLWVITFVIKSLFKSCKKQNKQKRN